MLTSFELFMRTNDLTQKTVADYLGVSQSRISHYATKDNIPLENRIRLINNPYGWDASMLNNEFTEKDEEDGTATVDGQFKLSDFMDIIRDTLKDYRDRLTQKDDGIKEIAMAVVKQNERLGDLLEKLLEAKA